MSYCAYDVNDYLGDVASIGGWVAFGKWARRQGGEIAALGTEGVSRNPAALVKELNAARAADPDTESVRANLAELAARAEELFIVSDGS